MFWFISKSLNHITRLCQFLWNSKSVRNIKRTSLPFKQKPRKFLHLYCFSSRFSIFNVSYTKNHWTFWTTFIIFSPSTFNKTFSTPKYRTEIYNKNSTNPEIDHLPTKLTVGNRWLQPFVYCQYSVCRGWGLTSSPPSSNAHISVHFFERPFHRYTFHFWHTIRYKYQPNSYK